MQDYCDFEFSLENDQGCPKDSKRNSPYCYMQYVLGCRCFKSANTLQNDAYSVHVEIRGNSAE